MEKHIKHEAMRENKTVEILLGFKCLGFNTSDCLKEDINIKLSQFQRMRGTVQRLLN
jgi:hypothetical protein